MGNYSYKRNVRIARLIERGIADILLSQRGSGLGLLTVVGVEVSDNLSVADVTVSFGRVGTAGVDNMVVELKKQEINIRSKLAKRLQLRKIPSLKFACIDLIQ